MYRVQTVVRCYSGLNGKQATDFVQKANTFPCSIWVESGSKRMNAKSLLGLMSLCIGTGASVTLIADGAEEQEAVDTLRQLLMTENGER